MKMPVFESTPEGKTNLRWKESTNLEIAKKYWEWSRGGKYKEARITSWYALFLAAESKEI